MSGRSLVWVKNLVLAGAMTSTAMLHAQAPASVVAQVAPSPAATDEVDRQLVIATCANCHPITQVTSKTKSPEDWVVTVDKMIALGAQVSEDDRERIITYLATHQAPPKP